MIESLCVAIPKTIVPRGTSKEIQRFERVTGIKKTRRFAGSTLEMIYRALDAAKLSQETLEQIQQVIVVTQTPDRFSPCLAVSVHDYLKLDSKVMAFDINRACDGWVFGIRLANKMLFKTLLICADRLRYEPNELESLIFSDAVSVSVIEPSWARFYGFTDGAKAEQLYCGIDGKMHMDGESVFDFVINHIPPLVESLDKQNWLCPHQPNLSMLKILESRTGYQGKMLYSIEEYGNQSMNSIPCALAANEEKILGQSVLCVGFGAGFTATAAAFNWASVKVSSIVEV